MAYLVQGGAPPDDSVTTVKIKDVNVTTAKIAANAVDETKLKDALIADFTEVTVAAGDSILLGDVGDSGNTKRDTVQGLLDLAGGGFTEGTSVATTSNDDLQFTGLDATTWKVLIVSFFGVSTSGTDGINLLVGDSGGLESDGYLGSGSYHVDSTAANGHVNTGSIKMYEAISSASYALSGQCIIAKVATGKYTFNWNIGLTIADQYAAGGGLIEMDAAIDIIQISTSSSATFDAGEFNIQTIA